jgi:hypothetical protein
MSGRRGRHRRPRNRSSIIRTTRRPSTPPRAVRTLSEQPQSYSQRFSKWKKEFIRKFRRRMAGVRPEILKKTTVVPMAIVDGETQTNTIPIADTVRFVNTKRLSGGKKRKIHKTKRKTRKTKRKTRKSKRKWINDNIKLKMEK